MGVSIHDLLFSTINFDFLGKYLLFPKILGSSIWGFVTPDVWCGVFVDKTPGHAGHFFFTPQYIGSITCFHFKRKPYTYNKHNLFFTNFYSTLIREEGGKRGGEKYKIESI
jgi:hypothetical protein